MTHFFEDKQQYLTYQEAFRQLSRAKIASAEDHILYNFIRGRDLKSGFSPLTNPRKIDPYAGGEWRGFTQALNALKYAIRHRAHSKQWYEKYGKPGETVVPLCMRYGETITEESWDKLLAALGECK